MPHKPPDSPLGAFLAALREEKIPCILIGAMAAIEQGAPLTTIDYDFWVRLRERQYIRILEGLIGPSRRSRQTAGSRAPQPHRFCFFHTRSPTRSHFRHAPGGVLS